MKKENGSFEYAPPEEGCAALRFQHLLPGVKVFSAYHNLSYRKLCKIDQDINADLAICSDHEDAKPLKEARMIESLIPFLINMAIRNGLSGLGVKFCLNLKALLLRIPIAFFHFLHLIHHKLFYKPSAFQQS
ncbi:MAG: hypothetical protein Q7J35_17720 [Candidatus Methanoperedens sp.]|nr:hypothetical protein [Candidatus Methanoperedens sp.]